MAQYVESINYIVFLYYHEKLPVTQVTRLLHDQVTLKVCNTKLLVVLHYMLVRT